MRYHEICELPRLLFHATRAFSAFEIFATDTLSAMTTDVARGANSGGVCFTRSYEFAKKFRRNGIVLVIDAANLRTKPVSYWSPAEKTRYDKPDEMEEFFHGSISSLSRYIVSINSIRSFDEWCFGLRQTLDAVSEFKSQAEIEMLQQYLNNGMSDIRAKWNLWKPVRGLS